MRQSVYSRLAGDEDLNDAVRVSADPTFRLSWLWPSPSEAVAWGGTPRELLNRAGTKSDLADEAENRCSGGTSSTTMRAGMAKTEIPIDSTMSEDRRVSEAKPLQGVIDILIVVAVSIVAFVVEDLANARGWISVGVDARGVTAVLIGALAAVCVVLARGGTLADLGFKRPKRWTAVPVQVAGILVAFIAVQNLAPLLVASFISLPEPDLSRHAEILGNLGAAITMALVLPLTASIPEEIIYRGFLIGRLSDIFGRSIGGAFMAVLVQALVFGAVHFQWGLGGMIVTVIMGMVWGAAYLLCDRNLWVVILAHSAGHILFVIQLYLGESIVV